MVNQLDQPVLAARRSRRPWRVLALLVALALLGAGGALVFRRVEHDSPKQPVPDAVRSAAPTPEPRKPARPGADTTGVPAGVTLKKSGPLIVTVAGKVIQGLDIDGCVDVKANGVVIKQSRITCSRPTTAIRLAAENKDLLVEDVEIDGGGEVSAAVGFSGYTLRRVDIHDVVDGPRMSSDTVIEDSWIHDMARKEGSHNDAIQTTGGRNLVIRRNTLDVYDAATQDFLNAAIMVGSTTAPEVRDMLVEDNYLDGGNFTINHRKDLVAVNVVYRNNRFGRHHRYGPVAGGNRSNGPVVDGSNIWDDSGQPISGP